MIAGAATLLLATIALASHNQSRYDHANLFNAHKMRPVRPNAHFDTGSHGSHDMRALIVVVGIGLNSIIMLIPAKPPSDARIRFSVSATRSKLRGSLVAMDVLVAAYGIVAAVMNAANPCRHLEQRFGTWVLAVAYVIGMVHLVGTVDEREVDEHEDFAQAAEALQGEPVNRGPAADPANRRHAANPGRDVILVDPVGCDKYIDAMAQLLIFVFPSMGLFHESVAAIFPEAYMHRLHVVYAFQLCLFLQMVAMNSDADGMVCFEGKRSAPIYAIVLSLYVIAWFARAGIVGALVELQTHVRRNRWNLPDR